MLKLAKLNDKPEIFHTIQGEGKNMGKPSLFIRLSLCNLYCRWCDTDYTWNWQGTKFVHDNDNLPDYKKYSKDHLILLLSDEELLEKVTPINCRNIVITGGEPLVQQKELRSFLAKLKTHNPAYHIEFETNGTLKPLPALDALADQYNVSIKLSNSNVTPEDRLNPEAIQFFAASPKSNFKFVVDTADDINEVLQLIREYNIDPATVYLMPQGRSIESLKQKENWLVDICKTYNFNYTDRLHIHIWGNKRGI